MRNPPIPALPSEEDIQTLGWAQEALKESGDFLKAQPGYSRIAESLAAVLGTNNEALSRGLSRIRSNRVGKIASDLAALLTDIKPFWEFKTSNSRFDRNAEILGKLSTTWYYNRQIDMRFADALRYWICAGTSYIHQTFNTDLEDIDADAEDPRDVLPIRPSGYESIQSAAGVILRRERTVNYVKGLFPEKAHLIQADRDGAASTTGAGPTAQAYAALGTNLFQQALWGDAPERKLNKIPVVDLFTMYVRDDRINETSSDIMIGQFDRDGKPMNNWSYKVPPGQPLYPRKRCIQFTRTAMLYNSTSIYWHGMYPLSKLTLDPWPTTWLGKAPMWDLLPLQDAYDRALRAQDDILQKFAQPDVIADKNSISRAALGAINTRAAGQKFLQNGMVGKGITLQYPQLAGFEVAKQVIEMLREEMDNISGVRDMSQLLRLNQMPGGETIDKLQESMTPATSGRSRGMEAFVREFAKMLAFNFAQFYTMPMRLMALGPDGITPEDFDTDPGSFIPAHVHAGDYSRDGLITPEAMARGPLPKPDRAMEFMKQFAFHVAPSSLLASSEIQRKMLYLQLWRGGAVDTQTMLETMGVNNIQTIMDRLAAQQLTGLLGGQVSPAGRKASGQNAPRLVMKES